MSESQPATMLAAGGGAVHDAIVIGGGPAGAAAACELARGRARVLLIERSAGPQHKVCGDFLSGDAEQGLRALGLDLRALPAAPIHAVRLIHGRSTATAALPFPAWSIARRDLDEALLTHAVRLNATVLRGAAVRGLTRRLNARDKPASLDVEPADTCVVEMDGAAPLAPAAVFLATGKHDLRSARRRTEPGDLVGFKTRLQLAPAPQRALERHVEVVLFAGGYAGLQLTGDGVATLCLLATRERLAGAEGSWDRLIRELAREAPHLAARLADAVPLLPRPLAVTGLPYGFVHRVERGDPPGLYRLGDQAAVIPSFTGDGVAIALHTGRSAAASFLAGETAAQHHGRLRAGLGRQVGIAHVVQTLLCLPSAQSAAVGVCRLLPGLLPLAAWLTRVPQRARSPAVGGPRRA